MVEPTSKSAAVLLLFVLHSCLTDHGARAGADSEGTGHRNSHTDHNNLCDRNVLKSFCFLQSEKGIQFLLLI